MNIGLAVSTVGLLLLGWFVIWFFVKLARPSRAVIIAIGAVAVIGASGVVGLFAWGGYLSGRPLLPAPPQVPVKEKVTDKVSISATCRGRGVAIWDVTLKNNSKTTTFTNIMYRSMYQAQSGARLRTNRGTFFVSLAPGQTHRIRDFNDGLMPQQSERCGMAVFASDLQ